jgi:hypothetical protein
MKDSKTLRSFAVFPFLKTSGPVTIGPFTFRATDDASGLDAEDAARLREVSEMLFVQDHFRIRSGSYTAVPYVDLNSWPPILDDLARAQAVVAYFYSVPHQTFGDPFLTIEHASLVIFSPDMITPSLVRSEYHTDLVGEDFCRDSADMLHLPGYHGLYNFRHHFWAVKGSRVFGPMPHVTLNISQDLCLDVGKRYTGRPEYDLVPVLLKHPETEVSQRVLTAIGWYNRANSCAADEEVALVHLAVAFEALLALPEGKGVTDRFREAVNLLLGRVPRLDTWLDQFYRARSQIVHEGRATNLRFAVSDLKAQKADTQVYHSLLSYGRKVFRLCVGTTLVGATLAAEARLAEKLVTNQERFEEICGILSDESVTPSERLRRCVDKIEAAERYRFVSESGLKIETLLGCAKRAAQCLLNCVSDLPPGVQQWLRALASAQRTLDHYDELEALMSLQDVIKDFRRHPQSDDLKATMFRLVDIVHGYTFMHFFWLKQQRAVKNRNDAEQEPPADAHKDAHG